MKKKRNKLYNSVVKNEELNERMVRNKEIHIVTTVCIWIYKNSMIVKNEKRDSSDDSVF